MSGNLDERAALTVTAEISVKHSEEAIRYAALNRNATVAKKAGDWDFAVSLLREAKALRGDLYEDDRLAKFLQQSGRFEEAMSEIQWLLDHAHAWAEQNMPHQTRVVRRCQQASHTARVHRAAALICKREKRYDLRRLHENECERWLLIHERLAALVESENNTRQEEWEAARANGRAAMDAFMKKWRPDQSL